MKGLSISQRFGLNLALFALLVSEELTAVSLGVLAVAGAWRWRRWPLRPQGLQLAGGVIFAAAYFMLGRTIGPEMGLNVLFGVMVLKWLEAREVRDWRMMTLGLFVLWATGTLFVRTPLYALVSLAAVISALQGLGMALDERLRFSARMLLMWALKALPLTVLLFVIFPRFATGLWAPPRAASEGQVGFSAQARPGEVGELQLTGALAFHVLMRTPPAPQERYWQGLTLSFTDGWNWSALPREESAQRFGPTGRVAPGPALIQEFLHPRPSDRLFALSAPLWWESELGEIVSPEGLSVRLAPGASLRRYSAVSRTELPAELKAHERRELTRVPKKVRELLEQRFPAQQLAPLLAEAQAFLARPEVSYTLTPGRIEGLESFLAAPRGWCTHFASFLALLLRAKGHPTRLVSGYFGGELNPETGHLSVSEDDAHIWPEVHDGTGWLRVDPTLWVAPQRAVLSGRAFHQAVKGQDWWQRFRPAFVDRSRQWVEAMNFRFLVWSESFDRSAQQSIAERFDLNLREFYQYGLWGLLLLGSLLFLWQYWATLRREDTSDLARLFRREAARREQHGEAWWRIWNAEVYALPKLNLKRLAQRLRREI